MGDPWSLTPQQWTGLILRIGEIADLESGERNHRAWVERQKLKQDLEM